MCFYLIFTFQFSLFANLDVRFAIGLQEGDVIELCQVSDIRAGGLPRVSTKTTSIFFRIAHFQNHFRLSTCHVIVCVCVYVCPLNNVTIMIKVVP